METILEQREPAEKLVSMFTVDVGTLVGPDFVPMANDVVRMVCIQLAIQVMLVLASQSSVSFFSAEFVMLLFYVVLGVMLYWLAVRKLFVFI